MSVKLILFPCYIGFASIHEAFWFTSFCLRRQVSIDITSKELIPIGLATHFLRVIHGLVRCIASSCDNMAMVIGLGKVLVRLTFGFIVNGTNNFSRITFIYTYRCVCSRCLQ